jgi:hypothetical protein
MPTKTETVPSHSQSSRPVFDSISRRGRLTIVWGRRMRPAKSRFFDRGVAQAGLVSDKPRLGKNGPSAARPDGLFCHSMFALLRSRASFHHSATPLPQEANDSSGVTLRLQVES